MIAPESPRGIKTNIITGFLGAGKSSAILKLLKLKPNSERWAVLVNEFGEVGIDGGLLSGRDDADIFIREVPGGCMCCAAGVPMQMAMNMLLARARPHRLIIEPTGLGHPFELMSILSSEYYQELLDIRATLTLVDARKISNNRYTGHSTFNEQLEVADLIVASKTDLYDAHDVEELRTYLYSNAVLSKKELVEMPRNGLALAWLQQEARSWSMKAKPMGNELIDNEIQTRETLFPPEGFIRFSNHGDGFEAHGWIFESAFVFDRQAVIELLQSTGAERVKALFRTKEGDLAFNFAGDDVAELSLRILEDSRIEVIASAGFPAKAFEASLLAAASC